MTDACYDALQIFQRCTLAGIEKFYDGLRADSLIPEALRTGFNPRALLMLMLQHSSPRLARWKGPCSLPLLADRSILAGSMHSNSIAKTVVYPILVRVLDAPAAPESSGSL